MYLQNRLCHANYNCTVVLGGILTENNNSLLHIRNEYVCTMYTELLLDVWWLDSHEVLICIIIASPIILGL